MEGGVGGGKGGWRDEWMKRRADEGMGGLSRISLVRGIVQVKVKT